MAARWVDVSGPAPASPAAVRSTRLRRAGGNGGECGPRRCAPAAGRPAASSSSASRSARRRSAVRARAAPTPPSRTSSSSGITSRRSRTRRETGIRVVRVVPERQPEGAAGLLGGGPADLEQRAQVPPVAGPHPGDRAGTGTAGQPQQHRLGLVVAGVTEQDVGTRSCAAESRAAYRAVRAAASGPRRMPDLHPDQHGPDRTPARSRGPTRAGPGRPIRPAGRGRR